MAAGAVQPLNPIQWLVAPALAAILAAMLFAAPLEAWGLRLPEPVFGLVLAFAWASLRPSVLAPFALLAVGLFQDLLWGDLLGLWPLALLAAYALTASARAVLVGQSFWTLWAWYFAAVAAAFGVAALLVWFHGREIPDLIGLGLQAAVTGGLFPVAWRLMNAFEDADVRFR
jgi:rod shape-determining protein MreD